MPDIMVGATDVKGKRSVLIMELKISEYEVHVKVLYILKHYIKASGLHVYEWMNIDCLLWARYCLGTVKSKIMLPCNKREIYVLDYLDVRNQILLVSIKTLLVMSN